jgi:riboflavin synthase
MFTGLIEAVGRVSALQPAPGGYTVRIGTVLAQELAPGDSLAVNGVCLTATGIDGDQVSADIGPETARITTLGALAPGQAVNLERPMRPDGRVGGHFVQGHVDGLGTVQAVRPDGDAHWLTVSFDPAAAALLVRKGSVALDGISLTVADIVADRFDVMIIPFTWAHTALPGVRPGDRVNLEFDMVGKYVARLAEVAMAGRPGAAGTEK